MSLSDAELRQLRDLLVGVFETVERRRYFLSLAFPSNPERQLDVLLDGEAREFTWQLIHHYYHNDRNSLLTILNIVQDEEGGETARMLQPFVEKLAPANKRHKIFVSYRRKSGFFMHSVVHDLRERMPEAEFFVDFASVDSADFGESIRRHLTQSNCFLLMLTDETLAPERLFDPNDWIRYEVRFALERGLPIIQVSDGTPPPRKDQLPRDIQALAERECRQMSFELWDAAIQRLVRLIHDAIANPPDPVRIGSFSHTVEPQLAARHEQDLEEAVDLYERREYERALPLLEKLLAIEYRQTMVETYLEKTRYRSQVSKQYRDIASLAKRSDMLKDACQKWLKFRKSFTDWREVLGDDPDNLDQALDPVRFSLFTNLGVLRGHANAVWSVAWSPDGQRLASGSKDGTVRLWDTESWQEQASLQCEDLVCAVTWSPRSRYLAAGLNDGCVNLWNVPNGQLWQRLDKHEAAVRSVTWSSNYLASAADDGTVRIWHLSKTRQPDIVSELKYKSRVSSVYWSHNGNFLAIGTHKENIQIWELETRRIVKILEVNFSESINSLSWVYSISWSPDGAFVAASTHEGVIVWGVNTGDRKCVYNTDANCVVWSPDSRYLASGSEEGIVQIWRLDTAEPVMSVSIQNADVNNDYVQSVAWSPDGDYLACASGSRLDSLESDEEGAIIIWGIPS